MEKYLKLLSKVLYGKFSSMVVIAGFVVIMGVCVGKLTEKPIEVSADNLSKTTEKLKVKDSELEEVSKKSEKTEVTVTKKENLTVDDFIYSQSFIEKTKKDVVNVANAYGLYPSIMMAQAIIESGWGKSALATEANNYFGIKARDGQAFVTMATEEDKGNGERYVINAQFAKYTSIYEGMEQNAKILTNNPTLYSGTYRKNAESYVQVAQALQGTYATATDYAQVLINTIEAYRLYYLDNLS